MATTVNAYLSFNGNCEEAFNFYKSVLGGEFTFLGRFRDMLRVFSMRYLRAVLCKCL